MPFHADIIWISNHLCQYLNNLFLFCRNELFWPVSNNPGRDQPIKSGQSDYKIKPLQLTVNQCPAFVKTISRDFGPQLKIRSNSERLGMKSPQS